MSLNEKAPPSPDNELTTQHTEDVHDQKPSYNDLDPNSHAYKGDNSDGKLSWSPKTTIAALSLGALYTGSQVNLYFVGGSLSYIEASLGATKTGSWIPVSNTLAITAVAPFVGYLQDLFGRRTITLIGSVMLMVGMALMGSAHKFGQGVAGMAISGAGAAVCELSALAGISDIVPVRKRGYGLALMVGFLLPFTPYVMYSQLLAVHATWRWTMWISLIWNAIVFLGLATTYFPKAHPRAEGFTKRDILKEIDWVGALLSVVGLTLLLVALQGGGYTHPWTSAYILAQLIIGILLIISFVIWEWKFAPHPMIPHAMFRGQKIVALAFFVAFIAGLNFYSLTNFFPLEFSSLYSPKPIQIGLKGLGYGMSVTVGAIFFNTLLSVKGVPASVVLGVASLIMTAFGGALAVSNPTNPKLAVALGTLAGFGVGGILVPAATVALIVVPDTMLATAAALSLSVRTLGGSIGYAIYYNIFAQKLTTNLPAEVAKYVLAAGLLAADVEAFVGTFLTDPTSIAGAPGYSAEVLEAATIGTKWAYAESLKWVWITSIPFGVLAVGGAALIPSIRKYQTNRVSVALG